MDNKNPIDTGLLAASDAMLDYIANVAICAGFSPKSLSQYLSLKNAIYLAKNELKAKEELEATGELPPANPPTSND